MRICLNTLLVIDALGMVDAALVPTEVKQLRTYSVVALDSFTGPTRFLRDVD